MPSISAFATASFYGLVVFVAALFTAAVAASGDRGEGSLSRWRWRGCAVLLLSTGLGVSGYLAHSGTLRAFDRQPPPLMLLIVPFWIATTVLAFSPLGTRLVRGLGIAALVGFQAFRLPLELLLHRLYREGIVPVQMTYSGFNFDIVTGVIALAIGFWTLRGMILPRWVVTAWNVMGIVLLLTIVTIAMLSTPTAMRAFHNEPANAFVADFPFIWLPTFLVQAAWFGHLLVFRKLMQR